MKWLNMLKLQEREIHYLDQERPRIKEKAKDLNERSHILVFVPVFSSSLPNKSQIGMERGHFFVCNKENRQVSAVK